MTAGNVTDSFSVNEILLAISEVISKDKEVQIFTDSRTNDNYVFCRCTATKERGIVMAWSKKRKLYKASLVCSPERMDLILDQSPDAFV